MKSDKINSLDTFGDDPPDSYDPTAVADTDVSFLVADDRHN